MKKSKRIENLDFYSKEDKFYFLKIISSVMFSKNIFIFIFLYK